MMDWQPKYDEELAELLTMEAERQKPPKPIEKTYWPEAVLFLCAFGIGVIAWWVMS